MAQLTRDQARKRFVQQESTQTAEPEGVSGLPGVVKGVGKGVISTFRGASGLGEKMLKGTLRTILPKAAEEKLGIADRTKQTGAELLIPQEMVTPRGTAENVGFYGEQIGEFFIPGSASLKVGKAAQAATTGGRLLKGAAKLGAISATEGILGTGQAALQSGKLGKEELQTGGISLLAPAVIAGAGATAKKLIPGPVKGQITEAISKAIRPSMKSRRVAGYNDRAIEAFKVMSRNQLDSGGVIPKTVGETLDALQGAKKAVYTQYDDIAKQSGEMGVKFSPQSVMADISNWVKSTGYSANVKDYAKARLNQLADLEGAAPKLIQDRIEELNKGISFFPSTSADAIKNQIDASVAMHLRSQLDDQIVNATGKAYQAIRNQYRALKTVEDDIARAAAANLRKNAKGFFDITDIFTGSNITTGLLTGNPSQVVAGASGRAIKEYINYVNSPNRNIRKIFDLIKKVDDVTPQARPTQKLLSPPKPGTPNKSVNTPINLGPRSQSTVDAAESLLPARSRSEGPARQITRELGMSVGPKLKAADRAINEATRASKGATGPKMRSYLIPVSGKKVKFTSEDIKEIDTILDAWKSKKQMPEDLSDMAEIWGNKLGLRDDMTAIVRKLGEISKKWTNRDLQ